jgi:regulator of replication initiation timing
MMKYATKDIQLILAGQGKYEPFSESDGITLEAIREEARIAQAMAVIAVALPPSIDLLEVTIENALLRREVVEIRRRLAELEERMPEEKVIILRQIPKEQANQEIQQLFSTGRTLYYSDIAEELQLELQLVVEICQELQEAGKIEIDGNAI